MSGFSEGERRELLVRARAAGQESVRRSRPVPVWLSRPAQGIAPLALFTAASGGERFFWEDPGAALGIATVGAAATFEGVGRDRLRQVASGVHGLFGEAPPREGSRLAGPLLVGGFAFSPDASGPLWRGFPAARFVLPEQMLVQGAGRTLHVTTLLVRPGDDAESLVAAAEARWCALRARLGEGGHGHMAPLAADGLAAADDEASARYEASATPSPARYRAIVRRALEAIHALALEKVVVARACTLSRPGGFDPARVLETLRAAHPACFRFAVGSNAATLIAATPERLLHVEGRRIQTSALAGSAARGRTPEEDARLGARLRESKKEQEEHAVVVRALREALAPCCEHVRSPEAPELLRLEGIQHLYTPIEATLRADADGSLLGLAARLHPSPAIAGAPREAALAWLREHECADRGWYAGAVGWMTPGGEGELAVALRTALLRGDDAVLHAGAGIVAGSTPEAELAETRLKLRSGLGALLEI